MVGAESEAFDVRRPCFRVALATAGVLLLAALPLAQTPADSRWWMTEPVRFLQTNISETDSTADPAALVSAVAEFGANTFLLNMGGIVAQYPTKVPFHYPSVFLPPGRDLFGDVVRLAHARRIRVVGRFDLSKTQKAAYDAHPEWFFTRANGEPAIYNGLYSTCINGAYYREHAMTILAEALDRYDVDGLFFNMFGNPTADYSGVPMGPCQCGACQARYRTLYGRSVPQTADADYRAFMADSSREVAAAIAELIHRKRPQAAFLTYIKDHTDGIMSESNTAVGRALPMWPYSASDNVSRSIGSEPDKIPDQPRDELCGFSVALCERAARGDRAAALPEHGARRSSRVRCRRDHGPGGSTGPDGRQADLPMAREARGPLRGPEERGARPASRDRRQRVVSRVLPAPQ